MDQDHREYLEDRGSHQLEVEAYEREQRGEPFDPEWAFDDNTADGKLIVTVFTWTPRGDARTDIALPYALAVTFANAILSEVEIAQRGDTE